jgi:hypothetical protein
MAEPASRMFMNPGVARWVRTDLIDDNELQLNGPEHEAARETPSLNQGAPKQNHFPTSPNFPSDDEPAQPDTIKLQPPPPTARPKRSVITQGKIRLGLAECSWSTEEELAFCARKRRNKIKSQGMKVEVPVEASVPGHPSLEAGYSHTRSNQSESNVNCRYIVVGIMGNEESIPREILLPILTHEDLFKQIRKAERELRSPFRRLLSLKRVGGFGVYRCHPSHDYHSRPRSDDETRRCVVELYRNYRSEQRHYQDRWMDWIHKNFNNDSINPEDGKYALQLLLRWSPLKLIIWSSIPIIFSSAIGLWYMINPHRGEDYVAIVQTAWTIASYIVTTAARKYDVVLDLPMTYLMNSCACYYCFHYPIWRYLRPLVFVSFSPVESSLALTLRSSALLWPTLILAHLSLMLDSCASDRVFPCPRWLVLSQHASLVPPRGPRSSLPFPFPVSVTWSYGGLWLLRSA